MPMMIFVNLPVTDVIRATAFYEHAGAVKNPRFSDASTSCMVFSDAIHVMLLNHERFMHFSPRPIANREIAQALLCLSLESRAEVDAVMERIGAAGGRIDPTPADDHGFMYGRSFEDPDGHLWQVMWMDPAMAAGTTPISEDCA